MKGVISGLPQAKINYTDIGLGIGLDKNNGKICIERVIKELAERTKAVNIAFLFPLFNLFLRENLLKWISQILVNF